MTDDHTKRTQQRDRHRDLPNYKHRYDAYGRIGGETVNMSELSNNDFKKVIVDILVINGLMVGVKTLFQLECEAAEKMKK